MRKDKELECATIAMPEMARLLGITKGQVYGILKNSKYSYFFETIVIAAEKRVTKESFQKFLDGQDYYKLDPANDYEELAIEQNAALANYRRKKLSRTGDRSKNGNLGYLTFDKAAFLANVSRGMIYKWIDDGKFNMIYNYKDDSGKRKRTWETYDTKAEAKKQKRKMNMFQRVLSEKSTSCSVIVLNRQ